MKYTNETSDYDILYYHDINFILVAYCCVGWDGNSYDQKSTYGGFFSLGSNLFSCFSKKQNCVSLSTTEAEYIAAWSICNKLF